MGICSKGLFRVPLTLDLIPAPHMLLARVRDDKIASCQHCIWSCQVRSCRVGRFAVIDIGGRQSDRLRSRIVAGEVRLLASILVRCSLAKLERVMEYASEINSS
jgi:hypothetical protein